MKSRTLITLIPTTAGTPRCAVIRQAENPNCRVRAWRASPHTRASSQLRVKAWPMNVWSNSQPVSRYVNHTSPTRRLAHFPQLSHELSPATGPYKRPQPATISLPRRDCNLGHIRELSAPLLQPLPVHPGFTPQRLADPFHPSLIRPSPPCTHCALASREDSPKHASYEPGERRERRLLGAARTAPPKRLKEVNCRRLGAPSRVSRTDPVPGPPKSGVTALKPLPRCQNKALGVDSTPLPDASARDLVTLRLWRRQRIWQ